MDKYEPVKVGDLVKVVNQNSSFWGESGKVKQIDSFGPFETYYVATDPDDFPNKVFAFSENEVERLS
jgi:hypothetical protein